MAAQLPEAAGAAERERPERTLPTPGGGIGSRQQAGKRDDGRRAYGPAPHSHSMVAGGLLDTS